MSTRNPIVAHKNLAPDNLALTLPEKSKGQYVSYLSNSAAPFYVQTPIMTLTQIESGQLSFFAGVSSPFVANLRRIDTFVIDTVAKRTIDFFAGKRFSRDWIAGCFESRIGEDDVLQFSLPKPSKDLIIKDQRGVDKKISDLKPGMKCIAIIHLPGVNFTRNQIRTDVNVVQLKVYIEDSIPWSILDVDSDEEANAKAFEDDEATIDDEEVDAEVNALKLASLGIKAPDEAEATFVDSTDEHKDDGNDLFEA